MNCKGIERTFEVVNCQFYFVSWVILYVALKKSLLVMVRFALVILCGVSGNRLRPLFRKSYFNQFLKLIGKDSLFKQAVLHLGNG